jgi:hypothetical protein
MTLTGGAGRVEKVGAVVPCRRRRGCASASGCPVTGALSPTRLGCRLARLLPGLLGISPVKGAGRCSLEQPYQMMPSSFCVSQGANMLQEMQR